MGKENVLEIEYQEVFDKIAVRIKNLNDDFFADGLLKEDVEKYKCQFLESPTMSYEYLKWVIIDLINLTNQYGYTTNDILNCYWEKWQKNMKRIGKEWN